MAKRTIINRNHPVQEKRGRKYKKKEGIGYGRFDGDHEDEGQRHHISIREI